jgi:hypothetical protein
MNKALGLLEEARAVNGHRAGLRLVDPRQVSRHLDDPLKRGTRQRAYSPRAGGE